MTVIDFRSLADRFWTKVHTPATGCWTWTASRGAHGYGQIHVAGKPIAAHRVSWYIEHGSWPPADRELDHLCRNRACVKPSHLQAVTRRTNFLRGEHPTAVAFRAGTCHAGHPRTPENVYVRPNGKRECRECMRESGRRKYAKKRAS